VKKIMRRIRLFRRWNRDRYNTARMIIGLRPVCECGWHTANAISLEVCRSEQHYKWGHYAELECGE